MTLKLIAGAYDVLPRSFHPWPTELLFNTDLLQTDSPRPYCLLEESVDTALLLLLLLFFLLLLLLCVSHPVLNTIPFTLLLLSLSPTTFLLLLVTKDGCGDAKNGAHILFSLFLNEFNKTVLLVVASLVTTAVRHLGSLNFFGTWYFFTTTSLSFQKSHHSDFVFLFVAGVKTSVIQKNQSH
ncbi:hypothetical protein PAMP_006807 [Pampus punctatissimus]